MGAVGKIKDSDLVDVANHALEQDALKYMTGSGRSYAAVLIADKKNDLRCPRRRNGPVAKGLSRDSRRKFNHDRCRNSRQGFGKTGHPNV